MDKFEYGFLEKGEYIVGQGNKWSFESDTDNRYPDNVRSFYSMLQWLGIDGWELVMEDREGEYIFKRKI
jgi:hypothetical protein